MSYTPGPRARHWHSIDTINSGPYSLSAFSTTAVWPSANLAIYVPVIVQHTVVVTKLWYGNGTTGTGNYDIGLYDAAGTALLRKGSTAKPTTGTEIVWDCTDTTLRAGLYYLALASDSGSDTFNRANPSQPVPGALGVYTEASAFTLPATATFAVSAGSYIPAIGMLLNTLVT